MINTSIGIMTAIKNITIINTPSAIIIHFVLNSSLINHSILTLSFIISHFNYKERKIGISAYFSILLNVANTSDNKQTKLAVSLA